MSIWKAINGFDGRYSLSENREVRRNAYHVTASDGTKRKVPKRHLKIMRNNGMHTVALMKPDGKQTQRSVAALMREHFAQPEPSSTNAEVNKRVEAPNTTALLSAIAGLDRPVARLIVEFA